MHPTQGEVWDIRFDRDDPRPRPGILVSRNELNQGKLLLAVPCTASRTEERAIHENNVLLEADTGGLSLPTIAQVHLIQPVNRDWFVRKRGKLDEEQLGEVLQALAWAVDLFPS